MRIEKQTILIADEGHYLTNGETFATVISLGKNDSPDNWYEVTEEEKEQTESEILGGRNTEPETEIM